MHLPALTETGAMGRMSANLSKLGLALRGAFGEGSRAAGEMYQISNQITLGLSEIQAIENLSAIAGQLMSEEKKLRHELASVPAWQDKVARAAGTLKSARLVSGEEATRLLSLVRFGVAEGMLHGVDLARLNGLWVHVQPATLTVLAQRELRPEERDQRRAELLRSALEELKAD